MYVGWVIAGDVAVVTATVGAGVTCDVLSSCCGSMIDVVLQFFDKKRRLGLQREGIARRLFRCHAVGGFVFENLVRSLEPMAE